MIFNFSWKNIGVLKWIPGVKLPKYTYTLIHFNTVPPKYQKINKEIMWRSFIIHLIYSELTLLYGNNRVAYVKKV